MLNDISQKPKTTYHIILWGVGRRLTAKKHKGTSWEMKVFYVVIVGLVIQFYALAQIHQILHLKLENFIVDTLYLNKPDPKTYRIF